MICCASISGQRPVCITISMRSPNSSWARCSSRFTATPPSGGAAITFQATVRLNSPVEVEYLEHGGILQRVLRVFNEQ